MLNQGGQAAWKAGHHMNGDLLGFKFDAWEGGHRVPYIARWPGRIPAGSKSSQVICHVDMLATLAAIVGRELKGDEGPDSFNVLEALTGEPAGPVRGDVIVCPNKPTHISIRSGKWMYISARGNGGWTGQQDRRAPAGRPGRVQADRPDQQRRGGRQDQAERPAGPALRLVRRPGRVRERLSSASGRGRTAAGAARKVQESCQNRAEAVLTAGPRRTIVVR